MNQLTFLWVARDRYLVDALFSQDSGYTAKALPKKLPLSFQPDLMPAKNDSILTTEYYLTKVSAGILRKFLALQNMSPVRV